MLRVMAWRRDCYITTLTQDDLLHSTTPVTVVWKVET